MNEYIVKDCLMGLRDCQEKLEKSRQTLTEIQNRLWEETLELSGNLGVMNLYLGILQRETE